MGSECANEGKIGIRVKGQIWDEMTKNGGNN